MKITLGKCKIEGTESWFRILGPAGNVIGTVKKDSCLNIYARFEPDEDLVKALPSLKDMRWGTLDEARWKILYVAMWTPDHGMEAHK